MKYLMLVFLWLGVLLSYGTIFASEASLEIQAETEVADVGDGEKESGQLDQYLSQEYMDKINSQKQMENYQTQLNSKQQDRLIDRISNIR